MSHKRGPQLIGQKFQCISVPLINHSCILLMIPSISLLFICLLFCIHNCLACTFTSLSWVDDFIFHSFLLSHCSISLSLFLKIFCHCFYVVDFKFFPVLSGSGFSLLWNVNSTAAIFYFNFTCSILMLTGSYSSFTIIAHFNTAKQLKTEYQNSLVVMIAIPFACCSPSANSNV